MTTQSFLSSFKIPPYEVIQDVHRECLERFGHNYDDWFLYIAGECADFQKAQFLVHTAKEPQEARLFAEVAIIATARATHDLYRGGMELEEKLRDPVTREG